MDTRYSILGIFLLGVYNQNIVGENGDFQPVYANGK